MFDPIGSERQNLGVVKVLMNRLLKLTLHIHILSPIYRFQQFLTNKSKHGANAEQNKNAPST